MNIGSTYICCCFLTKFQNKLNLKLNFWFAVSKSDNLRFKKIIMYIHLALIPSIINSKSKSGFCTINKIKYCLNYLCLLYVNACLYFVIHRIYKYINV